MSRRCNWLVPDWTAFPSINTAQSYTLDAKWVLAEDVWFRQLRCAYLDEAWTIYPSAYVGQSLSFSMHRRAGALDLSLYGAPNLTDTTTTLSADMTATQDSVVCTATTDFLSFGWVLVGGELMEYRNLNTDTHTVYTLRRGAGGTRAEVHYASDPVTHCSLWVKGLRSPNPVTRSTDPLEVPIAFIAPLELYVLSKVREAEQDRQEAKSLMDSFIEACKDIAGDPVWQAPDGTYQVRAYGSGHGGGIYPLGPFGTVVG